MTQIETAETLSHLVVVNPSESVEISTRNSEEIDEQLAINSKKKTSVSPKKDNRKVSVNNKEDLSKSTVISIENIQELAVNSNDIIRKHSMNSMKNIQETSVNSIRNIQEFAMNFAKKIQGSTPPMLLMKELTHSPNSLTVLSNSVLEKSINKSCTLKVENKVEESTNNDGKKKLYIDKGSQCEKPLEVMEEATKAVLNALVEELKASVAHKDNIISLTQRENSLLKREWEAVN